MLTGWDVALQCEDEHVEKMGAWIESFSFVPNPQVEILGIDLIQPAG
jgi:hypothetical protein